ncbi:MAG: hypothetical protein KDA84_22405, partial [Planctomycetaceae bacterium]|nr:hypothetical protein [Planctomycetaceae bacterium]
MSAPPRSDSSLRYHSYSALFLQLKDEAALRTCGAPPHSESPKKDPHVQLHELSVNDHLEWLLKDHRGKIQLPEEDKRTASLAPWLYQGICHVTFGHTDYLKLVLVDDFDLIFNLSSDVHLPTQHFTVGICPDLGDESLDIVSRESGRPQLADWLRNDAAGRASEASSCPFVELHDFLQETTTCDVLDSLRPESTERQAVPKALLETPLMVFTRYRLGGLSLLGHGLLFRRAMYRAMARKVIQVQQKLREMDPKSLERLQIGLEDSDDRDQPPTLDDVNRLKICFIDTQGKEEIGTYIYCTNMTVAVYLLTALASLTYEEVLQCDPSGLLEAALTQSKTHASVYDSIADYCNQEKTENPSEKVLRKNHFFSHTYSIWGISHPVYQ